MRVLFHEYGTQLRLEDDDRIVLNVLCGRVAEYGVEFALDASEIQGYKDGGDTFVRQLAEKVRREPNTYGKRGRFC